MKRLNVLTREQWLLDATEKLRPMLAQCGATVPEKLRMSVGFPGGGNKRTRIGECWKSVASSDGANQIFISPTLEEPVLVLATLAHELVHASDDGKSKHGGWFRKIATTLGLEGKMTATRAGTALTVALKEISEELGPYPHAALNLGAGAPEKKQSTRMIKVVCPSCGYTIRTTRQWIEVGLPTCPCGTEMELAQ